VHKDLKSGTLETAFEKAWFSSHPFHGTAEFAAQVWKIEATQVAQLDAFELLPEPLTRIQFRSIGRQTLYMQPLCCTIREELSDGTAAVDRRATPDDDHAAGDLAQQVLKERDHVVRAKGALLAVEVHLARWRQGTDGREMIARPPVRPENPKKRTSLTFVSRTFTPEQDTSILSEFIVMRSLIMPPVVSALLAFLAALFRSHTSLRLEHLALRHQLAVYQQGVHRPRLRPTDRLLWAWLSRLWSDWQSALAFVQPCTVIAWQRQRFRDHWRQLSQQGTPGRPRIAKDVRELIRTMWQANPTWGSPRIVGELRKLGIEVTKSTVETYRVRLRRPSSPTWKTFLKNHVQDLVALDFFVVPQSPTRCCSFCSSWPMSDDVSSISISRNTPPLRGPPSR
jgi:hypothetical protein